MANNDKENDQGRHRLKPIKILTPTVHKTADCSEIDRLKILLVSINNKIDSGYRNFFITYKVIGINDIMELVIPDLDLMITLIKPNKLDSYAEAVEKINKKVVILIKQISAYGNNMQYLRYDYDEIQNYAKKLYFKLINYYYNNLSDVDKVIDSMTIINKRTINDILFALTDRFSGLSMMNEEEQKEYLDRFEKDSNEAMKYSGKHPIFF